ncbi:hypothetical protein BD309DRAFT_878861, partial [Dichomitus squalens]
QGGVKVLTDSEILSSVIGSEMDWLEVHSLSYVFLQCQVRVQKKDTCGYGESFTVS